MGGFGGSNPWPMQWGGGPTDEEVVYNALRSAVGEGGSAKKDDGIDGLWRRCRARGLAAGGSFAERAALQAFPQVATDHIPVFEEEFGIIPPEGATDEDRRQAIVAAYTLKAAQNEVELAERLFEVDPRFVLVNIPRALASTVQLGKAFQPQDGTPAYGGGRFGSAWPNYSSDFCVVVRLPTVAVMPTPVDLASITYAKRLLRKILPSWVDFAVITSTGPFLLDVSPLDLTCMT